MMAGNVVHLDQLIGTSIATEAGAKNVLAGRLSGATVVGQGNRQVGRLRGAMTDRQAIDTPLCRGGCHHCCTA